MDVNTPTQTIVKAAFDGIQAPGSRPVTLTWPERIKNYRATLNREPYLTFADGPPRSWLYGVWLQNDYAVRSGYYGGYPGDYLKRIRALFPDKRSVLHVFAGKVDLSILPGDTLDLRGELAPTF